VCFLIVKHQNYSQISLPSDTNVNIGRTFSGNRFCQKVSDFANGSVDMPAQVPGDNENGDA